VDTPKLCVDCSVPMVPQRAYNAARSYWRALGYRLHRGRRLCGRCWSGRVRAGTLNQVERITWPRGALLDEYRMLSSQGHSVAQVAERLGVRYAALDRALCRAVKAGALTGGQTVR
jgi:hypothetical protein